MLTAFCALACGSMRLEFDSNGVRCPTFPPEKQGMGRPYVEKDGCWFCRLCNKVHNGCHEGSDGHVRNAKWYHETFWNLDKRDQEYEQWQQSEQARRKLSQEVQSAWCSQQQLALPPPGTMLQYAPPPRPPPPAGPPHQEHAAAAPAAAAAAAAAAAPAVAAAAAPPSAATSRLPGAAAPSAATFADGPGAAAAASAPAAHELQQLRRRLSEAEKAIQDLAELVRAQGHQIALWRQTEG